MISVTSIYANFFPFREGEDLEIAELVRSLLLEILEHLQDFVSGRHKLVKLVNNCFVELPQIGCKLLEVLLLTLCELCQSVDHTVCLRVCVAFRSNVLWLYRLVPLYHLF